MKMYVLCHQWLSPLQKGLQGAHAIVSLVYNNQDNKEFMESFNTWADQYETMVFLNGGNTKNLREMYQLTYNTFPTATFGMIFTEDEESLNNSPTAVAILVSEGVCTLMDEYRETPYDAREQFLEMELHGLPREQEFVRLMAGMRLA